MVPISTGAEQNAHAIMATTKLMDPAAESVRVSNAHFTPLPMESTACATLDTSLSIPEDAPNVQSTPTGMESNAQSAIMLAQKATCGIQSSFNVYL